MLASAFSGTSLASRKSCVAPAPSRATPVVQAKAVSRKEQTKDRHRRLRLKVRFVWQVWWQAGLLPGWLAWNRMLRAHWIPTHPDIVGLNQRAAFGNAREASLGGVQVQPAHLRTGE